MFVEWLQKFPLCTGQHYWMIQLNSTAVLPITLSFAPDIRLCHCFQICVFIIQYSEFVFNKWLSSVNVFILTVGNSKSQVNIFMYVCIYIYIYIYIYIHTHTHTHTNFNICNLFRGKGVDIFDTME
jgi:hypothetical protein